MLKIWVDADACPVAIKEILFRAAERKQVVTTLVANHFMKVPPSTFIHFKRVESGFDVADNEIVRLTQANDLVITSDIPLAAEVIDKGAYALNPRGEFFDRNNIGARLNVRDFMDTMRASGIETQGPPPLSQSDKQNFANHLDKYLQQNLK